MWDWIWEPFTTKHMDMSLELGFRGMLVVLVIMIIAGILIWESVKIIDWISRISRKFRRKKNRE